MFPISGRFGPGLPFIEMMVLALVFIPFIAAIMAAIYGCAMFDQLVRTEHDRYHDLWESDGKPYGFFWRSRESQFFPGCSARGDLACIWRTETPEWISKSAKLTATLRKYRWSVRFAFITAIIYVITLAFFCLM